MADEEVNKALDGLTAVEALRKHVRHEVSSTSPLGWGTVEQLEIVQKDNGSLTISAVEIHAAEKAPAVKKPSEDSAAGRRGTGLWPGRRRREGRQGQGLRRVRRRLLQVRGAALRRGLHG
jgi:hypothetical protein